MPEETNNSFESTLPTVIDEASGLFPKENRTSPISSAYPAPEISPRQSVWEKPVKIKVRNVISAEGELKPLLIAIGAALLVEECIVT